MRWLLLDVGILRVLRIHFTRADCVRAIGHSTAVILVGFAIRPAHHKLVEAPTCEGLAIYRDFVDSPMDEGYAIRILGGVSGYIGTMARVHLQGCNSLQL